MNTKDRHAYSSVIKLYRWKIIATLLILLTVYLLSYRKDIRGDNNITQNLQTFTKQQWLSHVIIPFHISQLERVIQAINSWNDLPPIVPANIRKNGWFFTKQKVQPIPDRPTFVFYNSGPFNSTLVDSLLAAFKGLSTRAKYGFAAAEVKFSELSGVDDNYLSGSRLQFEKMLNNSMGLKEPSYVMYMEPDCVPIRPNWLEIIRRQVSPPQSPFWAKGAIYRGDIRNYKSFRKEYMLHINGNALYNLVDPAFQWFYFDQVRPYREAVPTLSAYDTDIFRYLLDLRYYDRNRHVAHKFIISEFILNMWHTTYEHKTLVEAYPDSALVHGGIPLHIQIQNAVHEE